MAPQVEAFHLALLEQRIKKLPSGNVRKNARPLKDCALKELIQYSCILEGPRGDPKTKVVCEPVLRLFRQCANGLTVETTSWEDVYDR
ncbi:hypothetical protein MBLNU230_g4029t1 [Neophaeotheca triangularis]